MFYNAIGRYLLTPILIASFFHIIGCSSPSKPAQIQTDNNEINAIDIPAPIDKDFLTIGDNIQLSAIKTYTNGTTETATEEVTWKSSDSNVISISATGMLTPLAQGSSTITATLGDFSASVTLNVYPVATLLKIDITLQRQDMAKGTSLPLIATGIYSDNSARNISNSVTWSSQNPTIIEINQSGTVNALAPGTGNILAKLDNITSSAQITVTNASLVDISINNFLAEAIINTSNTLQAIGIFSDGSKQLISDQVTWASSNSNVATISNDSKTAGQVNAIDLGSTDISATLNNIATSLTLKVIDATLTDIRLSPNALSLAAGTSSQLQATGTLSNGRIQDISDIVSWETNAPDILNISNTGLVYGKTSGNATITASFNGISASSTITVDSAALVSIQVSNQDARIANNTKLALTATGIYSNGTHQDITRDVLWQSDKPAIVFVSNTVDKKGFAYSLSEGSAIISATLGEISGTTSITVNKKTLDGITILFDGSNQLAAGNEIGLSAVGNYSDGSTLDISDQVTWQASDKNICQVSTAEDNYGILQAVSAGACNITAKASNTGVFSTLLFTVTDATLQSISISPDPVSMAKGTSVQLIATGTYSDTSISDISNQVDWQANNTIVNVSNQNGSKGRLYANATGQSIVTASYQNISATSTITVSTASLETITISAVVNGDLNLGTSRSYTAIGTYSDQTTQDITSQVLWISSDTTTATVSNASDSAGKVTSLSAGNISLSAEFEGVTSNQLTITITDVQYAPVSLSAKATPYIILNDGTDSSTIQLNIQAANSELQVADGTQIVLTITNGEGTLSNDTITSASGSASFSVTSTTAGSITIKATISGTEISNYITVFATDDFANIIARYGFIAGKLDNDGLVPAGSKIGFLILNYANRSFTINAYEVWNTDADGNNVLIARTQDPETLNNNTLDSGGNILMTYTTQERQSNNYVAVYRLTEENTGKPLIIAAGFPFP